MAWGVIGPKTATVRQVTHHSKEGLKRSKKGLKMGGGGKIVPRGFTPVLGIEKLAGGT